MRVSNFVIHVLLPLFSNPHTPPVFQNNISTGARGTEQEGQGLNIDSRKKGIRVWTNNEVESLLNITATARPPRSPRPFYA